MSQTVGVRIDVSQVLELLRDLAELERSRALAVGLAQAADIVASEIRGRAPDSGIAKSAKKQGRQHKLKSEISVAEVKVTERAARISVRAEPYYARFVERGTKRMKSHTSKGFMRRAADSARGRARAIFADAVAKAVQEMAR